MLWDKNGILPKGNDEKRLMMSDFIKINSSKRIWQTNETRVKAFKFHNHGIDG